MPPLVEVVVEHMPVEGRVLEKGESVERGGRPVHAHRFNLVAFIVDLIVL